MCHAKSSHAAGAPQADYDRIETRKRPPVSGIDLEQALNYVRAVPPVPLEFFYRAFTQPVTFYKRGSRPALERFVKANVDAHAPAPRRLRQCVDAVARAVPHHVHFPDELAPDLALSEEQILRQGRGWCNEQARLLIAITQISDMPSRLVFVRFHTIAEVYVAEKWVTVDQSFRHVFETSAGELLSVLDIRADERVAEDANALYRDRLRAVRREIRQRLGDEAAEDKIFRKWAGGERPIQILESAGYHNYFIH